MLFLIKKKKGPTTPRGVVGEPEGAVFFGMGGASSVQWGTQAREVGGKGGGGPPKCLGGRGFTQRGGRKEARIKKKEEPKWKGALNAQKD